MAIPPNCELVVRCRNCDAVRNYGGFSSEFYNSFDHYVCANCGHNRYYDLVAHWVHTGRWYNPLSWGQGHWEPVKKETSDGRD